MNDTELVVRAPTPQEFIALRRDAGWHVPDCDAAEAALGHSLFAVCVESDGQCIGAGRVVGDGSLVFLVQDVIVLAEQQRKGCGTLIMDAIMTYITRTAKPAAHIVLFAARGLEPWYSRYGFIERPHDHLGPGMAFSKA